MSIVKNKLEKIFKDVFDDQKIKLKNTINSSDIENWDSLNHVKLILACEDEFKIKFDIQEVGDLNEVKDLIHLIECKTSK